MNVEKLNTALSEVVQNCHTENERNALLLHVAKAIYKAPANGFALALGEFKEGDDEGEASISAFVAVSGNRYGSAFMIGELVKTASSELTEEFLHVLLNQSKRVANHE